MKRKFSLSLTLALVLTMVVTSLALADTVTSDVDFVAPNNQAIIDLGNVAPSAVVNTSTSFQLVCSGNNHADQGNTVQVQFFSAVIPAGSLTAGDATIGPIPAAWVDDGGGPCPSPAPVLNDNGNSAVVITAPAVAGTYDYAVTYKVCQSNVAGQCGGIEPNDVTGSVPTVTFRLTVVANTPPSISVTGVTDGGSYEIGSVPAAGCSVTDTEDGNSTFPATLSAITGPLSAYGLGSQTASCSYTDGGGLTASASATYSIVDTTAPSVTVTPDRAPDHNGWYNAAVVFDTNGTDAGSGIASCTADQTYTGSDGTALTVSGSCTDNAGNSANGTSAAFDFDDTDPSVTVTPDRTPDHNGWYNAAIVFDTNGTDGTSGIDTCTADQNYTGPDGTGLTVNGSCSDIAGNSANGTSAAFDFDDTDPSVTVTPDRAPDFNGWYNAAVVFDTNGTDDNGIESCTADQTYTGPDGTGLTVNGSCTDDAGNTGNGTSAAFDFDDTDPSVTVSPDRSPDFNGWYNAAVVFDTAGTDATAGVSDSDCSADQTYTGPDGTGLTVNGSCTDDAGNTANGTSAAFDFDDTDPSVTVSPARAPDHNGWYNAAVVFDTAGTDATSGVLDTNCSADHNYTGPDGTGLTVGGSCSDNAGNSANGTSAAFDFDNTDPSITIVAPVGSYILNAAVASDYSCTDATSGLDTCVGPVASGANFSTSPVGAHSFNVNAADLAGNTASATSNYSVLYATGGICYGGPGHTILQPINTDGTSVFKQGSTVPAKFRVCDANGNSIGTPGVVTNFRIVQIVSGVVVDTVNEPVDSTTPYTEFRWSASDQQWIFNINTRSLSKNKTYYYDITLDDGSHILFHFGLK